MMQFKRAALCPFAAAVIISFLLSGVAMAAEPNPAPFIMPDALSRGQTGIGNAPSTGPSSVIEIEYDKGLLNVKIQGADILDALAALAEKAKFELKPSHEIGGSIISTEFKGMDLESGIRRMLMLVNHRNYLISYDKDGAVMKLEILTSTGQKAPTPSIPKTTGAPSSPPNNWRPPIQTPGDNGPTVTVIPSRPAGPLPEPMLPEPIEETQPANNGETPGQSGQDQEIKDQPAPAPYIPPIKPPAYIPPKRKSR